MTSTKVAFHLPAELEATSPPEARGLRRDQVRLLVSAPDRWDSTTFARVADFLQPGDLVVANDSATMPAALLDGRLHLSSQLEGNLWVVEARGSDPLPPLPGGARIHWGEAYRGSQRLRLAKLELPGGALDYLSIWGQPIRYRYTPEDWPLSAYQTIFAAKPGSAEMPSAGRPFTSEVLDSLAARGVALATLTLHTGVSSLEAGESPYPERFEVPPGTWGLVQRTRRQGGRVIAVGTTVVRALESVAEYGRSGWTEKVIAPGRPLRVVDGLFTGWHEPQATHLDMLAGLVGEARLQRDYAQALEQGYLWHEFGDMHLLLPGSEPKPALAQ